VIAKLVNRLEEALICLLLAAMTLLTFAQVVLRYVFNSGFTWALEASTYMFGWLVLLAMSYGVKAGSHIGVDVIVKLLPSAGQRVAGVIGGAFSVAYAVILLVGSYYYIDTMHTLGVEAEDIPIARWILLLALPIGFILLLWRLVETTWAIVTGRQTGLRLADEAREAIEQFHGDGGGSSGSKPQ
jgi:C4-dicarboxylate transporter DctQ subunit